MTGIESELSISSNYAPAPTATFEKLLFPFCFTCSVSRVSFVRVAEVFTEGDPPTTLSAGRVELYKLK